MICGVTDESKRKTNHAIRAMDHYHEIESSDAGAPTHSACVRPAPGHEDKRCRSSSDRTEAEGDAGTPAPLRTSFRSSLTSRAYSSAHGDTGLGKKYGA
jgi:hypothetical protein